MIRDAIKNHMIRRFVVRFETIVDRLVAHDREN